MAEVTLKSFIRKSSYRKAWYLSSGEYAATTYEANSAIKVGQEVLLSENNVTSHRAAFRAPTVYYDGEVPYEAITEGAVYNKLIINFTVRGFSGTYAAVCKFLLRAAYITVDNDDNASSIYTAGGDGTAISPVISVNPGETYSGSVTVTDNATIYDILSKGVAFDYATDLKYNDNGTWAVAYPSIDSIYLEFENPQYKPSATFLGDDPHEQSITEPLVLQWEYNQFSDTPQAKVDLSMLAAGESEQTVLLDSYALSEHSYTIAANTLPKLSSEYALYNYILKVYSTYDVASTEDRISCGFVFPSCVSLSPSGGEIRVASETIKLQWDVSAFTASEEYSITNYPTEFDIQYSLNSGETWITLAEKTTILREAGGYQYDVPPDAFTGGVIAWRIRPYVNGYCIDNFAKETFSVRVQASTSSVTCDGKPHPTIGWASSAQIAYQVRFAEYDSGAIYGSATSHTIPYYYADGTYPVQVRTQASDGTWSDWTELEYVTIKNTAPAGTLTISAVRTRHTVVISWESTTAFNSYILYRNGIPVYVGSDLTYTDVAAYGLCDYYVRGITGVNYLQSETVTIDALPAVDCMYDTQTAQWIPLKYSLQSRVRNYSDTANVEYKYYAGRTYPVAYVDGTKERQANLSYAFKTREDAERLKSSLGHLVIYKDTAGGRIIGILGAISWSVTKRFAANITIVQVDYKEEVRYEA